MITPTLERAILTVLNDSSPAMVPEPALWRDVQVESTLAVARAELRQALESLADRQQVLGVETDDYWKWKISPNGQARLQELNLAARPVFTKPSRRK